MARAAKMSYLERAARREGPELAALETMAVATLNQAPSPLFPVVAVVVPVPQEAMRRHLLEVPVEQV